MRCVYFCVPTVNSKAELPSFLTIENQLNYGAIILRNCINRDGCPHQHTVLWPPDIMPPKKDVPVKKPAGPSIPKPAAKPAAGAPPAKTKAEPVPAPVPAVLPTPGKTQEPPIDLSKVVVSPWKMRKEFGGGGTRVGYSLGD